MKAEWFVTGTRLRLSISYQQQNETSSGTCGCSEGWWEEIDTTLKDAAEIIIANVKKDWNWQAVENLNGWTALL